MPIRPEDPLCDWEVSGGMVWEKTLVNKWGLEPRSCERVLKLCIRFFNSCCGTSSSSCRFDRECC